MPGQKFSSSLLCLESEKNRRIKNCQTKNKMNEK